VEDAPRSPSGLSVVIPARDEAETIEGVVAHALASGADQVLVVDGRSTDDTAERARIAGATVVDPDALHPELGPTVGKGDALWRALPQTTGDVVAFVDGDLTVFDELIPRLVAPLRDESIVFSKADIRRLDASGHRRFGRVSQFTARPMLSLLFPEVADVTEPLSGQVAARREVLVSLPFEPDYGLEIGMLLDVVAAHGRAAVAHPDCGRILHGEQTDGDLEAMARVVARTILDRAGLRTAPRDLRPPHAPV
jgi:glucosyl-3-phosphoglycerate synthase